MLSDIKHYDSIEYQGETLRRGDNMILELINGETYRLPIVDFTRRHIWFEKGVVRIQLNIETGQILNLSKMGIPYEFLIEGKVNNEKLSGSNRPYR